MSWCSDLMGVRWCRQLTTLCLGSFGFSDFYKFQRILESSCIESLQLFYWFVAAKWPPHCQHKRLAGRRICPRNAWPPVRAYRNLWFNKRKRNFSEHSMLEYVVICVGYLHHRIRRVNGAVHSSLPVQSPKQRGNFTHVCDSFLNFTAQAQCTLWLWWSFLVTNCSTVWHSHNKFEY